MRNLFLMFVSFGLAFLGYALQQGYLVDWKSVWHEQGYQADAVPDQVATPAPDSTVNTPPPVATPPGASDPTEAKAIASFQGSGLQNTHPFTVKDQWEVHWKSDAGIKISLAHLDGKPDEVIANQTVAGPGSSFEVPGGQLYLKVDGSGAWKVWVVQVGPDSAVATQPVQQPMIPQTPIVSGALPDVTKMAQFQRSIVIVKGSNETGTGFLTKTPMGTCVMTNQHVISNNGGLTFQLADGTSLKPISLFGATDRDLALIKIEDTGSLQMMDCSQNISADALANDPTFIPGNSQGAGVVNNTPGNIVAVGPERVEVSNPIYPGNSGSPVIDTRSGKAVGVITEMEKSDTEGWANKASMANQNSAIHAVRYFALRFDSVPTWEAMDPTAFQRQTAFLDQFHEHTLDMVSLIKYIVHEARSQSDNGGNTSSGGPYAEGEAGQITEDLFKRNKKFAEVMEHFDQDIKEATNQTDAVQRYQELLQAVTSISDAEVRTVSVPTNFYSFNRKRAAEEAQIRQDVGGVFKKIAEKLNHDF